MTPRVHLRPGHNFRDVGGLETTDGAVMRRGLVYRSAHLHEADDDERRALAALGIRTVCDLRAGDEADARPSALGAIEGVEVLRLGSIGGRAIGDPVETILQYGFTAVTDDDLANFYIYLLAEQPTAFGRIVEACADAARHAVVIHCSAGKDRTGVAAALIQSVLGVPDDAVVADYSLTNELWSPEQITRAQPLLEQAGLVFDPIRAYFLAPAAAMERTLAHLRETHGSVAGFLTGPAGVSPGALTALRDALLD